MEPNEQRRKYDRDCYASMMDEQRNRKNAKRREARARQRSTRLTSPSPVEDSSFSDSGQTGVSGIGTPVITRNAGNFSTTTDNILADGFGEGWLSRNRSIIWKTCSANTATHTPGSQFYLIDFKFSATISWFKTY
ncbi:unnamed protein product [Urochloa humidicola]